VRVSTDAWVRLGPPPHGEVLTARVALPDITDRLACAIDGQGIRHLLIRLELGDDAVTDQGSRGVTAATRQLVVSRAAPAPYIDIICHDPGGYDAFDLVGGEIAERLASGSETPAQCVARVLGKWRRFWGQLPREVLSLEAQLGLFAELWFLCLWLIPKVGISAAVDQWRGPFGTRHDFERTGRSVETKATLSTRGAVHRINGLDQLAPPENGELLFFSLRARDEAGAANSLADLVIQCRDAIRADANALTRFESTLLRAGYSPVYEEEYRKRRLRVVGEELFKVEANFPRITAATFPKGVPAGVERLDYEINLSGFTHLRIATNPAEILEL
jgi:Putative  PD-(D/E)XK family member, (DUF4420)